MLFVAVVGLAWVGTAQTSQAQCSMGTDVGCGSDAREEIRDFIYCVIQSLPAPPFYNNPNCGGPAQTLTINPYYVDRDGDMNLNARAGTIEAFVRRVFGSWAGGASVRIAMTCNERSNNNSMTITLANVCN